MTLSTRGAAGSPSDRCKVGGRAAIPLVQTVPGILARCQAADAGDQFVMVAVLRQQGAQVAAIIPEQAEVQLAGR